MPYSEEQIVAAKSLYLKGYRAGEISKHLKLNCVRVVYQWIEKFCWADLKQTDSVEQAMERRLVLLIERDGKSPGELNEIDRLFAQRRKPKKIASTAGGSDGQSSDSDADGSKNKRKHRRTRPKKNDMSSLDAAAFDEKMVASLFDYQLRWREQKQHEHIRAYLKSRQIGATWYFAAEAFEDAVLTGDNQIFLSASRNQAGLFREYIQSFARDWFGLELQGRDQIELSNGATLYFLSTNARTSQGYHGHVYMDEFFWIPKFDEYYKVAGAMAAHKKWRRTLFSTPSVIEHEAYPLWSGDKFNARNKLPEPFPTFKQLQKGQRCADGIFRQIVTIDDAIAGGCDLFDIGRLRLDYSSEEFANLFGCVFIDPRLAVFRLADLEQCLVDSSAWRDYRPGADRPFGRGEVWLGYDPSRTRDDAQCVVLAPPDKPDGKHRVLEKHSWRGQNFTYQAAQIKKLTERFNVGHIGIDMTGIGYGVYDLVRAFYPAAQGIHYGVDSKAGLVLKAQNVVQNHRILWDTSHTDIAHALLTIRRDVTAGGQVTYSANRTAKTGHGDVAWAIMHALIREPYSGQQRRSSWTTTV